MGSVALSNYSVVLVYSAMSVYALAFIFFTYDLAKRMSGSKQADLASSAERTRAARTQAQAGSGGTLVIDRPTTAEVAQPKTRPSLSSRLGLTMTIVGWVLQLGGTVLRGIDAGRVPWENMYEFTLTATAVIIGVFIFMHLFTDLRFLGAYVTGFIVIFLGVAVTNYYVPIEPTPPPLQSYWLVIHVFVASLGTGFFGLGAGLAVVQLLQARRASKGLKSLPAIPSTDRLETLSYRLTVIGFVFWTFTLMAGAIWADHAWGRYWGWDTKEVWTLIVWVIYAGYIHARATRNWRGSRSATLAIIGFSAVLFNFTIVNIFFHGLHSYAGFSTPGA